MAQATYEIELSRWIVIKYALRLAWRALWGQL
jgi:hypothetical protein